MESNLDNKCVLCKNAVNNGARKCVKCGSYQDWRRFVFFGETHVLGIILALFSILVILWPRIDKFVNEKPEIRFSFLYYEYSPFLIKVVCSNSGYNDAFLKEAKIKIGEKDTTKDILLYWEGESPVLEGKSSKLFNFTMKYLVGDKKIDYPYDNFRQDVLESKSRVNIEMKVIQSYGGGNEMHRLNLPRPK